MVLIVGSRIDQRLQLMDLGACCAYTYLISIHETLVSDAKITESLQAVKRQQLILSVGLRSGYFNKGPRHLPPYEIAECDVSFDDTRARRFGYTVPRGSSLTYADIQSHLYAHERARKGQPIAAGSCLVGAEANAPWPSDETDRLNECNSMRQLTLL